jgi:hypothetical protein
LYGIFLGGKRIWSLGQCPSFKLSRLKKIELFPETKKNKNMKKKLKIVAPSSNNKKETVTPSYVFGYPRGEIGILEYDGFATADR